MDGIVEEALPFILIKDPLEACLAHFGFENFDIDGSIEEANVLLNSSSTPDFPPWKARFESLPPLSREPATPSLVTPPTLELKPLPATLILHDLFLDEQLFELSQASPPVVCTYCELLGHWVNSAELV